ncbi:hypothetical protein GCM10010211_68440 [Streptomyces albospinus]|uniref:Uncharacterized protein n=1 Tax=Streptomyces albospinus TaxID=285515 RepID=A0ABQ2VK92_9ACTN|nr:hypothetical protein GCM10010211_68440 [Streptomyces albospinus]
MPDDEGWYDMARIRYGARTEAEIAATRAAGAKLPDIWPTGVVALWEADPDAVAAVLPPPLEPTARPLVRATISIVDLPGYPLGAGSVAVAAVHNGTEGWYPLVMPMTHSSSSSCRPWTVRGSTPTPYWCTAGAARRSAGWSG